MTKILLVILSLGYATQVLASEESTLDFEREGFHFGLGTGASIKTDDIKDVFLDLEVVPLLSLDMGYNFTDTFALNLISRNILRVGVEAKLYNSKSTNTWFETVSINRLYVFDRENSIPSYSAGLGYAWEHYEIEIGVTYSKKYENLGKTDGLILSYKYIW